MLFPFKTKPPMVVPDRRPRGGWMELTMAVVLTILLANGGWAQSNETEQLKQKVEEQGKQIEALQQQLARIERALAGAPAVAEAPAQPRVLFAGYLEPTPARATTVMAQVPTQ